MKHEVTNSILSYILSHILDRLEQALQTDLISTIKQFYDED